MASRLISYGWVVAVKLIKIIHKLNMVQTIFVLIVNVLYEASTLTSICPQKWTKLNIRTVCLKLSIKKTRKIKTFAVESLGVIDVNVHFAEKFETLSKWQAKNFVKSEACCIICLWTRFVPRQGWVRIFPFWDFASQTAQIPIHVNCI